MDFAHDGAAGLELAERGAYDIVLLDLLLPKVSGVSVLQRILASTAPSRLCSCSPRSRTQSRR